MHNSAQRFVLAALLLVGIWIVTYWAWPSPSVADEGGITFDDVSAPTSTVGSGAVSEAPSPVSLPVTPPAQPEEERPAAPAPQPTAPLERAGEQRAGVIPPEFTAYTVQTGDNPWVIAERLYGDRGRWDAIAKSNPLVDMNRLRAGQTLRVPTDPTNIQGRLVEPEGAPPSTKPAPPEPDVTEYVITRGDTLSGIAKRFYGSAADWKIIFEANRSLISSPQDIRPGMKLRIPPAPRAAR